MIKKIFCFLCCTVILVLSFSTAFFSLAAPTEVSLPFPEPLSFGGYESGAVIWRATSGSTVTYYMTVVVPTSIEIGVNGGFNWYFVGTNNNLKCTLSTSSNTVAGYTIYLFAWSNGSSSYTARVLSSDSLSASSSKTVTIRSSSSATYDNYLPFGRQLNSSFPNTTLDIEYFFTGQVNQNDINSIYNRVNSINSSTTTIKNDVSSIKGDVSSIKDNTGSIKNDIGSIKNSVGNIEYNVAVGNGKLDDINSSVSDVNFSISFYSSQILSKLDELIEMNDYSEPSPTTTNSVANQYEDAENALSDDAFSSLNSFEVPDFNSNASSFGSGFVNAVQFLSSNMEFLTGNKVSSYNTETDKTLDNPIRKISTLIFVILTLGVVSFVLNIVSSKGSD